MFANSSPIRFRRKYQLEEKNIILYGGTLEKEWDVDLLIKAASLMRSMTDDFEIIISGVGSYSSALIEMASSLNLKGKIRFLGYLPKQDYLDMVMATDIAVVPLRDSIVNRNRFPIKALEYMAAGKAIVASRVGVMDEVLGKNEFGVLVDSDSSEAICKGILGVLRNPNRKIELGLKAKKAAKQYDYKVICSRLIATYKNLIA
jgi:glycosyltransferase involved in cell wall biosynthesis